MRSLIAAAVLAGLISAPAYAAEQPAGAPAAPSGAPKAAAEHGSSVAGKDAAANEMKAHNATQHENATMSDPNKNNK